MNKIRKTFLALSLGFVGALGAASVAGATPPTPAEAVGDMATDGAAALQPIILAVAGALVVVAAVRFGARWVLSAIGRGGR